MKRPAPARRSPHRAGKDTARDDTARDDTARDDTARDDTARDDTAATTARAEASPIEREASPTKGRARQRAAKAGASRTGATSAGVPAKSGVPAKTGASSTGTSKPGDPAGKVRATTYRGIRWRRDPGGKRSWYNEELERWQTWHPDADAPPLPPGWGLGSAEEDKDPASGGSVSKPVLGLRISRPRWRSPYRIVPIVLAVFVIAVALFQSLGNSRGGLIRSEKHAAEVLLGQCLAQNGTSGGRPAYSTSTVSCGSSAAAVKVVKVIPGTPGSPSCPSGTTAMQIPYRGVRYPHLECVKPVRPGG